MTTRTRGATSDKVADRAVADKGSPPGPSGAAAAEHLDDISRLRWALVDRAACACAAMGWHDIALMGAGTMAQRYLRQPWAWRGVRVACVLDDARAGERMFGASIVRPEECPPGVRAVVVMSERSEDALARRAEDALRGRGVAILRVRGEEARRASAEVEVSRIVAAGVTPEWAAWLVSGSGERHDATLPMLTPERTELHLRRYDFAGRYARGARVLDAACGTGYGSRVLLDAGAGSVLGIDIDAGAVAYARGRFAAERVWFDRADATRTGLAAGSFDLVTSFETIEHVPDPEALVEECARVLTSAGKLVISTPVGMALTAHHAHVFDVESFGSLLRSRFRTVELWGQREGDEPCMFGVPAGMFPIEGRERTARYVVGVCAAAR
mgnify:CR=1 FL=1